MGGIFENFANLGRIYKNKSYETFKPLHSRKYIYKNFTDFKKLQTILVKIPLER